jgi:hypothetical protein
VEIAWEGCLFRSHCAASAGGIGFKDEHIEAGSGENAGSNEAIRA